MESIASVSRILERHFDISELRGLCMGLGVDYDNLGGETLPDKARELTGYMDRRGRMLELIEAIRRARPKVDTKSLYGNLSDEDWSNGGSKYRQANAQAMQIVISTMNTLSDNIYSILTEIATLRVGMTDLRQLTDTASRERQHIYNRQDAQRTALVGITVMVFILCFAIAYLLVRG